ncbi:hypothetical protein HBI81_126670 [Parastagonospora nodorum]|nr:hypothetical protein HBI10_140760 [Parastagonospora nodorum]KAH4020942.1 hypothetical protein HBI13_109060 [Parastagonospora nodorum]KAH4898908.1 hypothetical protein HBH74_187830 [Parastagonospora nodorum]KAH4947466.1 hypothetical protein HBH73_135800 [Parastagonospora nodorum]KAH5090304.1 hypothetical protein HBH72_218940 [Parastagonospora nodorum]
METLLSSVEKVVVIPRDVRQRNLIFAAERGRERQACLRGGKALVHPTPPFFRLIINPHPIPSHPKHPIRPSRRPADPQSLPPPPQSASRGVYSPPIAPSLNTRKDCFSYCYLDSTARNVRA